MESKCFRCKKLKMVEFPLEKNRVDNKGFRCSTGRFDLSTRPDGSKIPHYFAWGGIVRPNKTVAKAQTNCLDYQQS